MPNLTVNPVHSFNNKPNLPPAENNGIENKESTPNGRIVESTNNHKTYICDLSNCGKQFSSPSGLYRHFQAKHSGNTYECDECDNTFTLPNSLKQHKEIHRNLKSYKCTICGFSCNQYAGLFVHKRSKKHKENLKKKEMADNREHLDNSSSSSPEASETSPAKIAKLTLGASKNTNLTNDGQKQDEPYSLPAKNNDIENKASTPNRRLVKSTNNYKAYICDRPNCGKQFSYPSGLSRHIRAKHSGNTDKCDECKEVADNSKHLDNSPSSSPSVLLYQTDNHLKRSQPNDTSKALEISPAKIAKLTPDTSENTNLTNDGTQEQDKPLDLSMKRKPSDLNPQQKPINPKKKMAFRSHTSERA